MSIRMMVKVMEDVEVTRPQQQILLAMADHADDDGKKCFPSVDRIAWKTGYKVRAVEDIMRGLRQQEILVVVTPSTRYRPNEYEIRLENAPTKMSFTQWRLLHGKHEQKNRGAKNAPLNGGKKKAGVHLDVKNSRVDAPEPSEEPPYTRHTNVCLLPDAKPRPEKAKPVEKKKPTGKAKGFTGLTQDEYKRMTLDVIEEDALGDRLLGLIRLAATERASGEIKSSTAWNKFAEPFKDKRAEFTDEEWRAGFDAAINAGAGNLNYVIKSANTMRKRQAQHQGNGFSANGNHKPVEVANGHANVAAGSPEEVVEALRTYDREGEQDLRKFANLALEWDFTKAERPPWRIYARLGNVDEERDRYLRRLKSVADRAVKEARGSAPMAQASG